MLGLAPGAAGCECASEAEPSSRSGWLAARVCGTEEAFLFLLTNAFKAIDDECNGYSTGGQRRNYGSIITLSLLARLFASSTLRWDYM